MGYILALGLSGCLMTSPIWHQKFQTTQSIIPIQVWTHHAATPVYFECKPANLSHPTPHEDWIYLGAVQPHSEGLYDPQGSEVFNAGLKTKLPYSCWQQENDTGYFVTAIRAHQEGNVFSDRIHFEGLTASGLQCIAKMNSQRLSWYAFAETNCTTSKYFTIVMSEKQR